MFNFCTFLHVIMIFQWFLNCLKAQNEVVVAKNIVVEIPLEKINNNYYGNVIVGTPKTDGRDNYQIFQVNFDTGSQHLWLMSTERCPTPDCRNVQYRPFDKRKSSTYTKSETTDGFTLKYTDGTKVTGYLGWDIVQLGIGEDAITINQTIGFATRVEGIIQDCDGIFGLGLLSQPLFPGTQKPPLWTLKDQYGIEEFGMYLSRALNGKGAGKLLLGGHDETLIQGDLKWHKVVRVNNNFQGYKIKVDKIILVNDKFKQTITLKNMLALPDSGNNVIVGPKSMFNGIRDKIMQYATFEKTEDYSFRCHEDISALPKVIFVMDGHEYVMYPHDYIWTLKSGKVCRLGIFGMETGHIVLGQIFMQTFYSKFSIVENQEAVGFARAKHP